MAVPFSEGGGVGEVLVAWLVDALVPEERLTVTEAFLVREILFSTA